MIKCCICYFSCGIEFTMTCSRLCAAIYKANVFVTFLGATKAACSCTYRIQFLDALLANGPVWREFCGRSFRRGCHAAARVHILHAQVADFHEHHVPLHLVLFYLPKFNYYYALLLCQYIAGIYDVIPSLKLAGGAL